MGPAGDGRADHRRDRVRVRAARPTERSPPTAPPTPLWVGVSTADDQAYIADQLAPIENRPGNESAIVAAARLRPLRRSAGTGDTAAAGRRAAGADTGAGRRADPFPTRSVTAFLPAARDAPARRRHERVSAGALLAACRATPGREGGRPPVEPLAPGDVEDEIPVPNPADRAELVAAIQSGRSTHVDDRFLVYLAGQHRYRDRLFVAAHDEPLPPGTVRRDPAAGVGPMGLSRPQRRRRRACVGRFGDGSGRRARAVADGRRAAGEGAAGTGRPAAGPAGAGARRPERSAICCCSTRRRWGSDRSRCSRSPGFRTVTTCCPTGACGSALPMATCWRRPRSPSTIRRCRSP